MALKPSERRRARRLKTQMTTMMIGPDQKSTQRIVTEDKLTRAGLTAIAIDGIHVGVRRRKNFAPQSLPCRLYEFPKAGFAQLKNWRPVHMKDESVKHRFIELRAMGWSFDRIAQDLKTSKPTLIAWSRELEIEISNLKAIEWEALKEKYSLSRIKQIELLGECLDAMKAELTKRDLSQVPAGKLFELVLKYVALLKQDDTEVVFRLREDSAMAVIRNLEKTEVTWRA